VNEEGKTVLVVVRDGKAVPTEVELTQVGEGEVKADGWVAVAKGLQEGDQVIVEGGYALPEGTPVKSMPLQRGAK
jgi:multidrug efflux pump subunit AcrA (membrane-fusion protein)